MLLLTTLVQATVFFASNSVALLADLIHNFGDALTAVPLGIAFFLRSARGENGAGYFVVAAIFFSACVALCRRSASDRPAAARPPLALAAAGAIGFVGNEVAALIRLRAAGGSAAPPWSRTAITPDRRLRLARRRGSAIVVALGLDSATRSSASRSRS